MTLNRASRKEADTRLSALRKQVSVQVFTLQFEDAACREARTAAEELAETTSRLSVQINEAGESGDLLRKYRVDALPALVVSAKDAPDLRVYGVPTAYALPALLDAIVVVGKPFDQSSRLPSAVADAAGGSVRGSVHVDLVASRRDAACPEAAAALWRLAMADHLAGGHLRMVPALRIVEDFPFWAVSVSAASPSWGSPFLLADGKIGPVWPFTDEDILAFIAR